VDPLQLSRIDAVNVKQIAEAGIKKASSSTNNNMNSFHQTLTSETTAIVNSRAEFGAAQNSNAAEVGKSLEKMIISLMMKPMFAEFAEFTFGKGVEADVYTSLFSDAVADEVATGGSLGLGKYIQNINMHDKSPVK